MKHKITIWIDRNREQPTWCAFHRYDNAEVAVDVLPPEAQDDPRGYCEHQWPEATVMGTQRAHRLTAGA